MLEKMSEFFDRRLKSYDEHMLTEIESADEFYRYTAMLLPKERAARLIDLGCGTGLELEEYFKINPTAKITGIDVAQGMLRTLKNKFPDKDLNLILGSYFTIEFGEKIFDAALSVESLHHYTKDEKIPLYKKLCSSLVEGGYFVLTDYFSLSDEEEESYKKEFERQKNEQGLFGDELYHFDTPLTTAHEIEALREAGFRKIDIQKKWGQTYTLKAYK